MKRIIIDADASPVINEVIDTAQQKMIEVLLVRNFNHFSHHTYPDFVTIQYVDDGADSADYKIVQLSRPGDLVVTQDYGLASLLLNKNIIVMHHNGSAYTHDNIDQLLMMRHQSSQLRQAGIRTKGPAKFTAQHKKQFKKALLALIETSQ
ncbi:YaiI/YqxD family protein [Macrococcus equipercicus]|uniref:UPF0178 protein ERX35_000515 n=1 Tax=Macrococcus equipercicus TaxID=69967 RepID=A0A9Q9F269_9STAP|nr:YaiI/YqxD family protein [Macrococcus equipercicus]KAA1042781.1 YaiI/YqxD family protein [Macrococcus equipercicus]UTH14833.1 YaiI/YqxD family protein [Macrococcus equipercicus]